MKQILLVKIDGIGDYLFFRLFWPQLAELGQRKNIAFDFLCSPSVFPLAEKYDRRFIRRIFYPNAEEPDRKDRLRSLFPKYKKRYQRALQYNVCLKTQWDGVFNVQTARFLWTDGLISRLSAAQKGGVVGNDLYMARLERIQYARSVYTVLSAPAEDVFILDHLRMMLQDFLDEPFESPHPALPFGPEEIRRTVNDMLGLSAAGEYIAFVPYTSSGFKNWDSKNFKRLAEKLRTICGLKILVLGCTPPGVKREPWDHLPNVINLLDKTSLDDAMKLSAGARYAVCTDTSLMHCALLGGAECACISVGLYQRLFMQYPPRAGVKQHVFFPHAAAGGSMRDFSIPDINAVRADDVWEYIRTSWRL